MNIGFYKKNFLNLDGENAVAIATTSTDSAIAIASIGTAIAIESTGTAIATIFKK